MSLYRIARLKTPAQFRAALENLGLDLGFDEDLVPGPLGPLAQPYKLKEGFVIGNRFCIQPMEGWDGTTDGRPTEFIFRRWERFGMSGGKLIWGGEAVAVRPEGRANPNQLTFAPEHVDDLKRLRQRLVAAHANCYGETNDLLIGIQLTHSGRFSRPLGPPAPVIVYHHPYLDARVNIGPEYNLVSDAEIQGIIEDYIEAAVQAVEAGFDFVDVKHCHGYLGHEFLSAFSRPGPYGGSLENRTRFMREIIAGIRQRLPQMRIGVRLSIFDTLPYQPGPDGRGVPVPRLDSNCYWFGADPADPSQINLEEPKALLQMLHSLGVELVNLSGGSPYYNPHIQRPALFPPSDGYLPPEDPLVGVVRQVRVAGELKRSFPDLLIVGSAYSYLQEWLPNVAQYNVHSGLVDFVGIGRGILSYPEMPCDVLRGKPLQRKKICRTFSDCTTAPRNGLVSGCYPLDEFYKSSEMAQKLAEAKRPAKI
jgi:2,4-dienoyl-CoA reductase-like NADH-dependent reductase (Old Yellow Enzyme family)